MAHCQRETTVVGLGDTNQHQLGDAHISTGDGLSSAAATGDGVGGAIANGDGVGTTVANGDGVNSAFANGDEKGNECMQGSRTTHGLQDMEVSSANQHKEQEMESIKRSLSSFAGALTTKQRDAERLLQKGNYAESLPWVRQAFNGAEDAYVKYLTCYERLLECIPTHHTKELEKITTSHDKRAKQQNIVRDNISQWIALAEKKVSKAHEIDLLSQMDRQKEEDAIDSASTTGSVLDVVDKKGKAIAAMGEPGKWYVQQKDAEAIQERGTAAMMSGFPPTLPHQSAAGPRSHTSNRSRKSFTSVGSKGRSNRSHASRYSGASSRRSASHLDDIQGELAREQIMLEEMEAVKEKWAQKKRIQAEEEEVNYEMEMIRLRARQKAFEKIKRRAEIGTMLKDTTLNNTDKKTDDDDDDDNVFVENKEGVKIGAHTSEVFHQPCSVTDKADACKRSCPTSKQPDQNLNLANQTKLQSKSHFELSTPVNFIPKVKIPKSTPKPDQTQGKSDKTKRALTIERQGSVGHSTVEPSGIPIPRSSDPGPDCYSKCLELVSEQLQKLQLDLSQQISCDVSRALEVSITAKAQQQLNPEAKEWQSSGEAAQNADAPIAKDPTGAKEVIDMSAPDVLKLMHSQIVESNRELASAVLFPLNSIDTFYGDPLEFKRFKAQFEARVGQRVTRVADKLKLLESSLSGSAKDAVSLVSNSNPEQAYTQKWQTLERRFGQMQLVSNAYVQKLTGWKPVVQEDDEGLRCLAMFMNDIVAAMPEFPDLHLLNYSTHIADLIKKLPSVIQGKWRETVRKLEKSGGSAVFADLAELITEYVEIQSHPLYGKQALKGQRSQGWTPVSNQNRRGQQESAFATLSVTPAAASVEKCSGCQGQHDIEQCKDYMSKSIENRKVFIIEKKLCFTCLQPGHMAKNCTAKRSCEKCSKKHPTSLHLENPPVITRRASVNQVSVLKSSSTNPNVKEIECTNAQAHCDTVNNKRQGVYHAVVPVKVYLKGSDAEVLTYAFLDSGSSATFICDDIREQLSAVGEKTFLKLKTLHGTTVSESSVINDLIVSNLAQTNAFPLPATLTRQTLAIDTACVPRKADVAQWSHLAEAAEDMHEFIPDLSIGLLIGNNCPRIMEPGRVLPAEGSGVFAVHTPLGWTVHGLPARHMTQQEVMVNRAAVAEVEQLRELVVALYENDYIDRTKEKVMGEKCMSPDDERFIRKVKASTTYKDGSYCVGLPFRDEASHFPNNRAQAEKRAYYQARKMRKDISYHGEYCHFVSKMLKNGYARALQPHEAGLSGDRHWFLPHHGVFHPVKHKIRVVFDCSATMGPVSLNNALLQGPNLMNTITGVLSKFRLHKIAFMADIESMYHRVKVPRHDQKSLKFLWWPDGDLEKPLQEYAMTSHVFGAVSSPTIAIFTLQQTAREHAQNQAVAETIVNNFYVDDMLKSCPSVGEAARLLEEVRRCCAAGGFRLTKFSSNSTILLSTVPESERAQAVGKCLIEDCSSATERTLGLYWEMSSDTLRFNVKPKSLLFTRRGVLATIASVYDPLGFASPVVLPAKRLLQELCRPGGVGWDDDLPAEMLSEWQQWLSGLPTLNTLAVQRSFELSGDPGETLELAVCADASSIGHAAAAYVRTWKDGVSSKWHFAMGKTRVAPMKAVATIPRLELAAAVTAVQLAQAVQRDIGIDMQVNYYTDSEPVLRYILNERHRLNVYVTNRVRAIRMCSDVPQWWYIPSSDNPADEGSRGLTAAAMVSENKWLHGPTADALNRCRNATDYVAEPDFECQVMEVVVEKVNMERNYTMELISYHARWTRLIRVIIYWWKFITWLRLKGRGLFTEYTRLLLPVIYRRERDEAERVALMLTQQYNFRTEYKSLSKGNAVLVASRLSKLNPFMKAGLIRLGGRLRLSELTFEAQHPVILPGKAHVTRLIIRHVHENLGHVGRTHTLAAVRQNYWVVGGLAIVRNVIQPCVTCRRVAGVFEGQKMADLPRERTTAAAPFTWVGIDYFGPFLVKNGRKSEKRYGVLFTCLSLRSVHCEMAYSLTTDGFIMAMRRFISRRGHVQRFYSDNGSNFVGAEHELSRSLAVFNQQKIQRELSTRKIEWTFNPPYSSHRGGVWERMIRSIRRILNSLMEEAASRLSDESLMTFLCEIECILNSRPLTTLSQDPKDQFPLTPEQILTHKAGGAATVPGIFPREDLYARKQWRRVQHLAEAFWRRWHIEYLPTLQERGKWHRPKRSLKIGDLVMAKEDSLPRGEWPVGVVVAAEAGSDGLVRTATFRTAKRDNVVRAVQKLILLVASDAPEVN